MTINNIVQIIIYLLAILILVKPLGWYMARVYQDQSCGLDKVLKPVERIIYRISGIQPDAEMGWITYLSAMLLFNIIGLIFVYAIQRLQCYLPLNPQHFAAVSPNVAFNTATSFVTNTNWQAYAGESTMSYLTQMLALTVQNFVSAATGMSLLVAFIRGITRSESIGLGNFWKDMVRSVLYVLVPLSFILAVILVSQGVIQNYRAYQSVNLIQPVTYQQQAVNKSGVPVSDIQGNPQQETITQHTQLIPMGPVASQIAIKQLGTNGGGFFNANSAHPFENPTPLTNWLEMLAIILIPAALCYTYGTMVKDKRQGWAVLIAMFLIFTPLVYVTVAAEQTGNPMLTQLGVEQKAQYGFYPGGNMEGKETRFGIADSAIWASATAATSNGSVNSMHDSYTPLGGLIPLWLMHLGEVIFGGVGSGLYGMLLLVVITVFVAGLMVGRTPEFLGKKIEPYEMKMASMAVLVMPLIVLVFTAIAVVTKIGVASIANPGAHGFTEILYAFSSMGNNNGSAFAGLNAGTSYYTVVGAVAMLISRYWIAIPTLALAGALVRKKTIPNSAGTLATHTPLFIILLIGVTIVLGALSFVPALALGPIVEQLMLWGQYGH